MGYKHYKQFLLISLKLLFDYVVILRCTYLQLFSQKKQLSTEKKSFIENFTKSNLDSFTQYLTIKERIMFTIEIKIMPRYFRTIQMNPSFTFSTINRFYFWGKVATI